MINAVRWVGIANSNDSDVTRYVQYIFAFIIGETDKTTGMDKKDFRKKILSEVFNEWREGKISARSAAKLLGTNHDTFLRLTKKFSG